MKGLELHTYQDEAVASIFDKWDGGEFRRLLLVQATGTGKTIVMSAVLEELHKRNPESKFLFLAHREELLEQAYDKITRYTDLKCAYERGKESAFDEGAKDASVIISSVQTMSRDERLEKFDPKYFTHILIDECHHAAAATYKKVISRFPESKILGVTATPSRADKKELSDTFDTVAYEYSLKNAICDRYLSPIVSKMLPLKLDLSNVDFSQGDYKEGSLGKMLEPFLGDISETIVPEITGKKTIAFLPTIETSKRFCALMNERGIRSAEVDCNTPKKERKEILKDFAEGKIDLLANSMLLTEGFDCPAVDTIVPLRATANRSLYQQIIGRGTRLNPADPNKKLLLLDFLWLTKKHDLAQPYDLLGFSDEVRGKIAEMAESGEEIDLMETGDAILEEILTEREKEEQRKARELGRFNKLLEGFSLVKSDTQSVYHPTELIGILHSERLLDYEPIYAWEQQDITEAQSNLLDTLGVVSAEVKTKGHASAIIDEMIKRQKEQLASIQQVDLLETLGFRDSHKWQRRAATAMLNRCAEAGMENNVLAIPPDVDVESFVPEYVPVEHGPKGISDKQLQNLEKFGFDLTKNWNGKKAYEVISVLSNNNWTIPEWMCPISYDPDSPQSAEKPGEKKKNSVFFTSSPLADITKEDDKAVLIWLRETFKELYKRGYRKFNTTLAPGYPQKVVDILAGLQKEDCKYLKVYGMIPFWGVEERWTKEQQTEFKQCIYHVKRLKGNVFPLPIEVVRENPNENRFKLRDHWCVENTDAVVCLWDGSKKAVSDTMSYAKILEHEVLYFKIIEKN